MARNHDGRSTSVPHAVPAGFTVRAPRMEDAAAVAALINARSHADIGVPESSEEDVRAQWSDAGRDLSDEDWLIVAAGGRIVGFLELYEYEPYTLFEFDGHVHPDATGRGIGTALLNIIESRARRAIARAPAGERVALQTRVWSTSTAARRLLEAHGYEHVRDWRTMRIDFDGPPPAPSWPPGIAVRDFDRERDTLAVWEAIEAAWQDLWGYTSLPFDEFVRYRIELLPRFDPTLWFLATDGDVIAGVLMALPDGERAPDVGRVPTLGVRREYRGRGIGMALLREAFGEFYRRGYRAVMLTVDATSLTGAQRLYERAGMREVRRACYYEKELRPAS
jgi:mycothiol synthase